MNWYTIQCWFFFLIDCTSQANKLAKSNGFVSDIVLIFWSPTSSMVSSCGVAALSSESFCEPVSAFLRTSRLFLCLCASFFTWPSALPLLSRLTGLVSHLRKVFPGRLGPGELCKWPGCSVALPESPPSLLETESVSSKKERERHGVYMSCWAQSVVLFYKTAEKTFITTYIAVQS